jgi:ribosomal silencing factor RsfS
MFNVSAYANRGTTALVLVLKMRVRGMTSQQWMLAPLGHLILPVMYPEVRVCPFSLYFRRIWKIDDCSRVIYAISLYSRYGN